MAERLLRAGMPVVPVIVIGAPDSAGTVANAEGIVVAPKSRKPPIAI